MRTKRENGIVQFVFFLFVSVFAVGLIFSQDTTSKKSDKKSDDDRVNFIVDDEALATKELIGPDASKSFYKVVIDTFEEAGDWYGRMPNDQGYIRSKRQQGGPLALKGSPEQVKTTKERIRNPPKYRDKKGKYRADYYPPYKDNKKYVLGARIDFQRRGHNWFALYPNEPIRLSGLVKAFEVWVAGRQREHVLSIIVSDVYGNNRIIPVGKLNFRGWRRLSVNVPEQVRQYDYRLGFNSRGLTFRGFLVTANPIQSWGKYYIYIDNFAAEISRFIEENQDETDPLDNW